MDEEKLEQSPEQSPESEKLLDNVYVKVAVIAGSILVILVSFALIYWGAGGDTSFLPFGGNSDADTEEAAPRESDSAARLEDEEDEDADESGEDADGGPSGADSGGPGPWQVVAPVTGCNNRVDFSDGEVLFDNLEPWGSIPDDIILTGDILGTWSFEGQLSLYLYDENAVLLGQWSMVLQDDWMTEELVPFSVPLVFDPGDSEAGTIVVEAANPSDLVENCREMHVQVTFE